MDVDQVDQMGRTAMHHAASVGEVRVVDALVELGSLAVTMQDRNGMTPLQLAMASDGLSVLIVETFVRYANNKKKNNNEGHTSVVNMIDKLGRTPMHAAARKGDVDVIEALVRLGCTTIDAVDSKGRTPLHHAAIKGHAQAIEALVRLGCTTIDAVDGKERTPIENAIGMFVMLEIEAIDSHEQKFEGLVELGNAPIGKLLRSDPDNDGGEEMLDAAVNQQRRGRRRGHRVCITILVGMGCKTSRMITNEWTGMHVMTQFGQGDGRGRSGRALQRLVEANGGWIDNDDGLGRTSMHHATIDGQEKVMEMLVQMGSRALDHRDKYGCTPMHLAALAGRVLGIQTLLRLGAGSLDGIVVSAGSAAGCSIRQHHPPTNHSPPTTSTSTSSTRTRGQLSTRATKAMDMRDMDGRTPIRSAVDGGHVSVIRTLVGLGSGALDTPDNHGHPPMYSAVINESAAMVGVLRSVGATYFALPQSTSMLVEWIDSDSALLDHIPSGALADLREELDVGARNGLKLLVSGGGWGVPVDGVRDLLKSLKRPLSKHGLRLLVCSSRGALDLNNNQIGNAECTAIGDALKINSTLTSLHLRSNRVGGAGCTAIGDALKINSTLTTLHLSSNQVGDAGCTAIANALKINSTLTTLNLSSNLIGAEGCTAIGDALKINSTLTSLYLRSNQVGDAGCTVIANALKINSTLTTLDLSWNQVGDAGCTVIGDALKINSTLTTLDLSFNQFGFLAKRALRSNFGSREQLDI